MTEQKIHRQQVWLVCRLDGKEWMVQEAYTVERSAVNRVRDLQKGYAWNRFRLVVGDLAVPSFEEVEVMP